MSLITQIIQRQRQAFKQNLSKQEYEGGLSPKIQKTANPKLVMATPSTFFISEKCQSYFDSMTNSTAIFHKVDKNLI